MGGHISNTLKRIARGRMEQKWRLRMQDSVGTAHKTTEGLEGLQQTGNEQDMKTLINVISVSEIWLFYFYFISSEPAMALLGSRTNSSLTIGVIRGQGAMKISGGDSHTQVCEGREWRGLRHRLLHQTDLGLSLGFVTHYLCNLDQQATWFPKPPHL